MRGVGLLGIAAEIHLGVAQIQPDGVRAAADPGVRAAALDVAADSAGRGGHAGDVYGGGNDVRRAGQRREFYSVFIVWRTY